MRALLAPLLLGAVLLAGAAGAEPARVLRPLPAVADAWTLDGEIDAIDWPVRLDAATAARGAVLRLAVESGVSVMPEASTLTVSVNGRVVGQSGLGGGGRTVDVELPPAALVPGWNAIRVTANQRHRVDCTVAGTYELWSRIDPAVSGLEVSELGRPADTLADLADLAPAAGGDLPIRLRLARSDPADLAAGFALTGALARLAGTDHPIVDVDAEPGPGPGVDVAYGSPDQIEALGIDPILAAAAVSGAVVLPATAGSRPTLVLADRSADGLARSLDRIAAAAASRPASGVVEVDGTAPVEIPLSAFGVGSEQFSGRLWRRTLRLALPADALTADYDSVVIRLDTAYAPDLSPDNGLSVFVGGRLTATVPFGNRRGEVADDRRIEVPLGVFRPGLNEIRLEAAVAAPEDAACDPRRQISGAARFLILDSSTVTVPRIARMAKVPDLSGTIADGRTAAGPDRPVRIALAATDPDTLSAAGTLYARMAVAADRLVIPEIVDAFGPADLAGAVLVGAAPAVTPSVWAAAGLTAPAAGHPWAAAGPSVGAAAPSVAPTDAAPLLDAWRARLREDDGFGAAFRRRIEDAVDGAQAAAGFGAPVPASAVPPTATVLLAQGLTDGSDDPVTLVTAGDPAALRVGVERLTDPALWTALSGRMAIIEAGSDTPRIVAADRTRLVVTAAIDAGNLRLVTAAWLSAHSGIYAVLLLGAATLFGLATFAKVRRSGVRRP